MWKIKVFTVGNLPACTALFFNGGSPSGSPDIVYSYFPPCLVEKLNVSVKTVDFAPGISEPPLALLLSKVMRNGFPSGIEDPLPPSEKTTPNKVCAPVDLILSVSTSPSLACSAPEGSFFITSSLFNVTHP